MHTCTHINMCACIYIQPPVEGEDPEPPIPDYTLPDAQAASRAIPLHIKHAYPSVLKHASDYQAFLPKVPTIPGAEENYGLMYSKPETEAERNMHELWMARRRQEVCVYASVCLCMFAYICIYMLNVLQAFEWKSRQHMALVMDRLALHKSRMETEGLRKLVVHAYSYPHMCI